MFKKAAALLLSAVIMAASSTVTFAESAPVQTVVCEQELGASAAKVWDGKTKLESGRSYVLKKSATIKSAFTVPKGTTLTLNKGAKLTVGKNGKLTVNGTLTAKAGSTIVVSGKLALGKTSKDTFGGKLTVNKSGAVSGTPKSVKLGKKAAVTVNGKNTCKKLAALLGSADTTAQDKKDIEAVLNAFMKDVAAGDITAALKSVYPEQYIDQLNEAFKAYGMTLDEFFKASYDQMLAEYGVTTSDIQNNIDKASIVVTKLTDCIKDMTAEEKAVLDGCGDITKAYTADITGYVDGKTQDGAAAQVKVAKAGGKWYIFG